MSDKIAPLRGMKDLLPEDFRVHRYIEETAYNTAKLYGYEGCATPILESAKVFDRTLGDTSDVVSKEMYCFESKGGELIALRPEFTAGIMRAFISNGLKQKLPLKLFSAGPVFRYDRPQKGRQRQFHQLNFEYIGAKGPISDAETICLAAHILEKLDILKDVTLELNSLGCAESRKNYQYALKKYFQNHYNELSGDSKSRLEKNPLRILDSKDENDKKISQFAPIVGDYYTNEASEYFNQVKKYLDIMQVKYVINNKLVRGLDYYSHTAFEFVTDKLGAQGTVLAGGRYDGLSALMGSEEIASIGFAAGIERIELMREYNLEKDRLVVIIPIGEEFIDNSIELANKMRKNSITTLLYLEGKIAKRMQNAISNNAKFIIFIGEEEVKNNIYKLKDLDNSLEQNLSLSELIKTLS